jgi:hypothetical protein
MLALAQSRIRAPRPAPAHVLIVAIGEISFQPKFKKITPSLDMGAPAEFGVAFPLI